MTGLVDKVKNALQSEKNTPGATAANAGHNGHGPGLHSGFVGERRGSQLPGLERGEHLQDSPDPHNKLAHTTTRETNDILLAGGLPHEKHGLSHHSHHHQGHDHVDSKHGHGSPQQIDSHGHNGTSTTQDFADGAAQNLGNAGSGQQGLNRDVGLVAGAPAGIGYAENKSTAGPTQSDSRDTANLGNGMATDSSRAGLNGSERPVDIVHPGDHVTETAKRLDPEYS